MKECIISIGSNYRTDEYVIKSHRLLLRAFSNIKFSSILQTAPIEWIISNPFYNQLAVCHTLLPLEEVIAKLKHIQTVLGRREEDKQKGVVLIDLDLLSYDGVILKSTDWQRSYIQIALDELVKQ